jgi:hypothetical protein
MTTGDALGRMDSDTDADAAPDTDDPDLRARVAELEASVAQQQETITKMLPGRRGVLKGAALLGGGALVGAGTADRASAQAAGQIGTASDPVDVEAYDLAVQNQLSSNLDAGGNDITNVGSISTNNQNNESIPTPTAYFSGPAHGEGGVAFRGATLAPDGRVIFAPSDSSNVGIFDPSNDSYVSGPAHGEGGGAFIGATLAPDGRVVFAPSDSSNVGIFDPSDDSYTSGPAHGEGGGAFRGATLAPDGRVIFAPFKSSNVGITSQLLDFAVANGGNK